MAEGAPEWLRIDRLVAGYDQGTVLHELSLSIGPGEAVGMVGRNGAGKTTLLRAVMGLVPSRSGTIAFNGGMLNGRRPFEIARRGIAYVPQGRDIFGDLTVEENLLLGNLRARDAEAAFAAFPALGGKRTEAAGRLSGGQQQQLAIARALMAGPRLLLLDEPSEGVQPSIVEEIGATLSRVVAETGMSLLLVEQNIPMMLALTTRVVFMDRGSIVAEEGSAALAGDPGLIEMHLAV
jgi:ABC-type branched-subunit amino acid transport system ATPase component